MKKLLLALVLSILASRIISAGTLYGRIIYENGRPLAKVEINIEGKIFRTNEFGGYSVELSDGVRQLKVVINNITYTSDVVKIYSPSKKQNWIIDFNNKKLIKTE